MKILVLKTKDELIAGMEAILRKQDQVNVLKPAPAPAPKLLKRT